jgi:hypothetical protein
MGFLASFPIILHQRMDFGGTIVRITLDERIESLKVGGIAGLAFAIASLLFLGIHLGFLGEAITALMGAVRLAGGAIAGFLFGVTYRYIIQGNENPHLKDGAVAAFALVRGLAPLQASEDIVASGWRSGLFLGESFVCFLVSRWAVDSLLARK